MEKLSDCSCGSDDVGVENDGYWMVACGNCGLVGPAAGTRAEAIRLWNKMRGDGGGAGHKKSRDNRGFAERLAAALCERLYLQVYYMLRKPMPQAHKLEDGAGWLVVTCDGKIEVPEFENEAEISEEGFQEVCRSVCYVNVELAKRHMMRELKRKISEGREAGENDGDWQACVFRGNNDEGWAKEAVARLINGIGEGEEDAGDCAGDGA